MFVQAFRRKVPGLVALPFAINLVANLIFTLSKLGVNELLVCGMMTQNYLTHTAIAKAGEKYAVSILVDCCTTVDEMIHSTGLHAVSTRVKLVPSSEGL